MKDPRVAEIEFLSWLDHERPSSVAPQECEKRFGLSKKEFRDLAFGPFRDGCLEGIVGVNPPEDGYTGWHPREWGQTEVELAARSLLRHISFAAYVNHAGRLRLWRLQDEIARGRLKDQFGLLLDKRQWDTDLLVRLATKDPKGTTVVMFIDVDDFKSVNTKAGYLVGDEVLRIVFQTVLTFTTGIGEAYRWGGDEITVLMPDANLELGERLGEAIREDVEKQCRAHAALRAAGVTTTVSVGVGAFIRPTVGARAHVPSLGADESGENERQKQRPRREPGLLGD